MGSRVFTYVLLIAIAFALIVVAPRVAAVRLPGGQQGYEPAQPIAFSHRLHAGEMQIGCTYCHFGAEGSRHAGIPAASVCMNCHRFVTAPLGSVRAEESRAAQEHRAPRAIVSSELSKLYAALGVDARMQAVPGAARQPIAWTRVHKLPDFVYFDHRPHVATGVACQQCHGPVETMERMRQVAPLTMGWCVNCHRDANRTGIAGRRVNASIDCSTCHY